MTLRFRPVVLATLLCLLPRLAAADDPPAFAAEGEAAPVIAAPAPDSAPLAWSGESAGLTSGRSGSLHPFLAVTERYTDNLFNTADNRQSDWITVSTPGLWLGLPPRRQPPLSVTPLVSAPGGLEIGRFSGESNGRLQAFALYRADIERHARFAGEDRVNQRGEGFLRYTLPRGLSLELLELFEQKEDPRDATTSADQRLDRLRANLLQGRATLPLGSKLALRADYTHYRLDFDAADQAFRERQDQAFAVNLAYRLRPATSLVLRYEHLLIDYRTDLLPDSQADNAYAGCEWDLSARSRGRVLIGAGRKDFRPEAADDRTDLLAEARVDYRLSPKTAVYLQFTRKPNEPDSPTSAGTLSYRSELGWQQRLTPRLRLAVDGSYQLEDYRRATIIAGQIGVRRDTSTSLGLSLGYAPWSWLNVDLGYRYLERDSNFALLYYDSNSVYLRLTAVL